MNENNNSNIKRLLDLYYAGEATASEEKFLRNYFKGQCVDPEFDMDREFFNSMSDEAQIVVPADLETKLSSAIDSWEMAGQTLRRSGSRFSLKPFRLGMNIAASVAILLGIGSLLFFRNSSRPVDTFTDPMEAYAETQRVLDLFASTLDKSLQGIDTANRSQEKAINIAMEQLHNL